MRLGDLRTSSQPHRLLLDRELAANRFHAGSPHALVPLAAIRAAGLGLSVADGAASVRAAADWVSSYNGGCGAVREACEYILESRGELARLQAEFD